MKETDMQRIQWHRSKQNDFGNGDYPAEFTWANFKSNFSPTLQISVCKLYGIL